MHREATEEALMELDGDTVEDPDPAGQPGVLAMEKERAERVRRALDRLPEPQRAVVHLHRFEGLGVRRPLLALAGGAAAALAAAVGTGGPEPLGAGTGLHCLLTELGSAAAVVGAGWLALRGGATSPARRMIAAAAAAGALAGWAALQVTCPAREALAHGLVFHLGGVFLAAFAASLFARRRVPAS